MLSVDRRVPFALTQVLGLSYDDTAQVCDCSPGTVRSRVARARSELLTVLRTSGRIDPSRRHGGEESDGVAPPPDEQGGGEAR